MSEQEIQNIDEGSTKLTVVEQKEVEFYGGDLTAVRAGDGRVEASIRHRCEALGIDHNAQQQLKLLLGW